MRGVWTVLATGFTLAVIALSMAMNFSFGHALGTSPANARILGTLSVACDGLKAFLPVLIAWQWADGRRLAAAAGALLFALLLAYGAASAIGFAAENRAALAGTRDNRNSLLEDATAQVAAMQMRLSALPAHRLPGVIDADIAAARKDRAWDATRGCTLATLPASREFCKRIDQLTGELAVSAEAAALAATIERLHAEVRQAREAGAGSEPDPQARAITQLTGLDMASVRSGLAWLLAIAVEAISAFGLFAITRRAAEPSANALGEVHNHSQWRLAPRSAANTTARGWRLLKAR